MNRLALGLMAGAFGTLFAMPTAMAQSWQDMQRDQNGIEHKEAQIHHDQHELNQDVRNGDYGAARQEQHEMNRREARLQDQEQDLSQDQARHAWHHHHHHHHDHDDD